MCVEMWVLCMSAWLDLLIISAKEMRTYLCWDSTIEETEEDTVVSQFFKVVDREESEKGDRRGRKNQERQTPPQEIQEIQEVKEKGQKK